MDVFSKQSKQRHQSLEKILVEQQKNNTINSNYDIIFRTGGELYA